MSVVVTAHTGFNGMGQTPIFEWYVEDKVTRHVFMEACLLALHTQSKDPTVQQEKSVVNC